MSMQQGRNWHSSKIEFSVHLENTGKKTQFKIYFKSEDALSKYMYFL